jgi:outer membrane protein insertion porin family
LKKLTKIRCKSIFKFLVAAFLYVAGDGYCFAKDKIEPKVYTINEVILLGNERFSDRELKRQLNLKDKRLGRSINFNRRLLDLDRILLETIYVKNGYLNCAVRDSFVVDEDEEVNVYFFIEEGRQYHLKEINISGNKILSEKHILELLGHRIGQPYNPVITKDGIPKIISEYANIGKPFTFVNDSIVVNQDVKLFIEVNEGPTVYIGNIEVINNEKVRDEVIYREILVKPGDLYFQERIDLSKKRIFETGLFSVVNVRFAEIDTARNKLDLIFNVRELDMRYVELDFGVGQDRGISSGSEPYTSLEVEGGWSHRNVMGRGSRFSTNLNASFNLVNILTRPRTEAEITYTEPWLLGFRSSTSFRLFVNNQRLSEQEITRYGGEMALIYQPDKRFYLKSGVEINNIQFQVEQDTTIDEREIERAITFVLRRDYRDNFLFPTKGTVFSFEGKIVPQLLLGSTQNYYKFETSLSHYINITDGVVFAYRGKFGLMDVIFSGKTPNYEKFYLGGETSLRGWRDRQFVPDGGNIKMLLNAEVRFPIYKIIGGEIFLDGGSLCSDIMSVRNMSFHWDAGFGLTIATPLGPVRLEYAKILEKGKGWQFQFAIPYAF